MQSLQFKLISDPGRSGMGRPTASAVGTVTAGRRPPGPGGLRPRVQLERFNRGGTAARGPAGTDSDAASAGHARPLEFKFKIIWGARVLRMMSQIRQVGQRESHSGLGRRPLAGTHPETES
jgi:hypothetical protein